MKRILFIYPDPPGFSGQREAGEQIIRALEGEEGFHFFEIRLPGFPRTEGSLSALLRFVFRSIASFLRLIWVAATHRLDAMYVSLCQTNLLLRRELLLMWLVNLLQFRKLPTVISLHGSVFMTWNGDEPVARRFRKALSYADRVTVLGPNQEERITARFVKPGVASIMPNTCEVPLMSEAEIEQKQREADANGHTILHLSTLMEPKGYLELIEALPSLQQATDTIICGKLVSTRYDERFAQLADARRWIKEQQEKLGFRWLEGAYGDAKSELFAKATLFVFPSRYPVEAQPLVLLEAMASGCAIVTSTVGEIPSILGEDAVYLDAVTPADVSDAINTLLADTPRRVRLALGGHQRFISSYTLENYRENWRTLFESLG
ncbi:MAG: glycosyltransferase family 4 protein [Planctomycetota bacterium]